MTLTAMGVIGSLAAIAGALVWCGMKLSFFAGQLVFQLGEHEKRLSGLEQRFTSLPAAASAMVGAQPFRGLTRG